jgi:hypothetical protein
MPALQASAATASATGFANAPCYRTGFAALRAACAHIQHGVCIFAALPLCKQ